MGQEVSVLFDDEGDIKAALLKNEAESSAQVESTSGKRFKIKTSHLLMRFVGNGEQLLNQAKTLSDDIDIQLLWEMTPSNELVKDLHFSNLAQEYFGASASPTEQAACLLKLHAAPMYFYKKGKGQYAPAPKANVEAALAGLARKAKEAEQMNVWIDQMRQGKLPQVIADELDEHLHAPNKNNLSYKALAEAARLQNQSILQLLNTCGALNDTHAYHFNAFLAQSFPKSAGGTGFPPAALPSDDFSYLPLARATAFSIDDADTTEIDDAFSIEALGDGRHRIGIHIAVPAMAIQKDDKLDQIARSRLSTVYMPGNKITMLPPDWVTVFSLDEGKTVPCLSLYSIADAEGKLTLELSQVERITMMANLRHQQLNETFVSAPHSSEAFAKELHLLHIVAKQLQIRRNRVEENNRQDWNFYIDHADKSAPDFTSAKVRIEPRSRGSPIDLLVSELMIWANSSWGGQLAEAGWPGLYRTQQLGKTKMSAHPAPHEGLGLKVYAWCTSPLRRYSDLINQRQILALIADTSNKIPAYTAKDTALMGAVADFDATYAQYNQLQDKLEHYWCLRFIAQERIDILEATVIRDNLVRFNRLPIVRRMDDLPPQASGTVVRMAVTGIDLLANELSVRYLPPQ